MVSGFNYTLDPDHDPYQRDLIIRQRLRNWVEASVKAEFDDLDAPDPVVTFSICVGDLMGTRGPSAWVKSEDCWIFSPGPHPLRVVF